MLGAWQALDEALADEATKIMGGLAGAVAGVNSAATSSTSCWLVKPASGWQNPSRAASTAMTLGSPKRMPGACRPSG